MFTTSVLFVIFIIALALNNTKTWGICSIKAIVFFMYTYFCNQF